ncbi:enoyl-CoA hydratase/isomerase family protein [Demequina globuliformis]|uniref:enoyl-CoA hydratase/isomerase family protein n=1 Tax=Demequina globuliformis TaxID=676202 RepID=UPI00078058F1|nr:enoyl-CoA hydratase/isomerase family protein [Demequina globuliformis]
MPSSLEYHVSAGVAHITLSRPERLNAIDFDTGMLYRDACLDATSRRDVRAILVSAKGTAFCAGGDVLAMNAAGVDGAGVTEGAHTINAGIQALVQSAVPVVAAVQGAVAGGGIGIMLAADYIVASPTLRVAGKYADIGLTPDLGVSTLLARAIGERRALEVLLTARTLDAPTALEWGLVAEVADAPAERANALASTWADGAWEALGQAKRLVRAGQERELTAHMKDEAASIGRAYDSAQARARIEAFASRSKGNHDG